ncbi:RNA polymerase sigma factor (sigma-70 family) [Dysgonomonadaceae bacterium PH5-43]|nr:RNA polymerase sigma factor (sigma-70 family) [Dysgonomonadaceae bacterium PH5-43]
MDKYKLKKQEQEFIAIVKEHEKIIYKVCSFYISEQSPIEDLYQDVVLNLWQAYPKFRNESSYSTWIYRVALNKTFHL